MQENSKEYLGKEDINKLFWKLSLPAIIAQLINMLYNIVDRIYIGHISDHGSLALTGVGVCMPIIVVVSAFAAFAATGGAPRASIFMGKGKKDTSEKILGGAFSMQVIISIVLTLILLIFGKSFLLSFGASKNTINYALEYLNIYSLGTIFVELTLSMNAFITAQGDAKTAMYTVLIGALINIVLDPILIFMFKMGVRGAALATIISQAISCVWVVKFLTSEKSYMKLKKENLFVSFNKYILPSILLGLATFIMQSSEAILGIVFNSSLLKYGGDIAVGAMAILTSVTMFVLLPLQGMGQGAQPITSYNFGAGKVDRVRGSFKVLIKYSLTYSTIMWLIIMIFPQVFARIFTPDKNLVAFTSWAIRIYGAGIFVMGIQLACQMSFVAIGSAKVSIAVAVLRKFVLLIPLIYILPNFLANKVFAVYLAEPVADFTAVICTMILFKIYFAKALIEKVSV
ncbi:MAG: MATE family efflux transporter [Peptoniphilaceae bacterium]|nr:MATE family efflux transporter [Peptoniphilaceae bacterium]MDY6018827.1 MATE family efflux transporter [Anaerococcus sp.]